MLNVLLKNCKKINKKLDDRNAMEFKTIIIEKDKKLKNKNLEAQKFISANMLGKYIDDFMAKNEGLYPWHFKEFINIYKIEIIPKKSINKKYPAKNIFDNNINTTWISKGTNIFTYEKIKLYLNIKASKIERRGNFITDKIIIFSGSSTNKIKFYNYSRIKILKISDIYMWMNKTYTNISKFHLQDKPDFQVFSYGAEINYSVSSENKNYLSIFEIAVEDIYLGNKYKNAAIAEIIFIGTLLQPHGKDKGY